MPWWLLVGLGTLAIATIAVAAIALLFRRSLSQLRRDPLLRRIGALPSRRKLSLVRRLVGDGRVPWWTKALLPALALYLAMPFDLIPDFIPVFGYLDDVLVVLVVGWLLLRAVPRDVVEEKVRALEDDGKATTSAEGRGR